MSNTTIYSFWELLQGEGLPHYRLEQLRNILNEVLKHTDRFHVNTPELVQLAGAFSQTFQCLDSQSQQFIAGVLTMPVFFMVDPNTLRG